MAGVKKKENGLILQRAASERPGALQEGVQEALLLLALTCGAKSVTGISSAACAAAFLAAGLAVCGVRQLLNARSYARWFCPGVLAALLVLCLTAGSLVSEGFCAVWNQICAVWTARAGRLFMGLETRYSAAAQMRCAALFCGILGILAGVATGGLCRHGLKLALILWNMGLLASAAAGGTDDAAWIAASVICCLLLVAMSGRQSGMRGRVQNIFLAAAALAVLSAVVLGLLHWSGAASGLEHLRERTEQMIHTIRYETDRTTLPEGDFRTDADMSSGGTALLVTAEQPEALYLRGFVGDIFEEDRWLPLSDSTLAEQKDTLYWLYREDFRSQGQYYLAASKMGETETNRVTVRNVGACSRYLYLPYQAQMIFCDALMTDALSVSGALASGICGSRSYSDTAVQVTEELTQTLLDWLQTDGSESVLAYRQLESSYRTMAYTYDLDVPDQVLRQLGGALDACCSRYGAAADLTLEQAQRSALLFLQTYMDQTTETVSLPLSETAAGTQYQYATVAALALRYYGIPARYAEGYIITEEMAADWTPGETLALNAAHAGAWVEIYQDGLGWMPVDVTPGFAALAGTETETGIRPVGTVQTDSDAQTGTEASEGKVPHLAEGRELEEDVAQEEGSKNSEQDRENKTPRMEMFRTAGLVLLLVLLLILTALLLFVLLRRRRALRRLKALAASEDKALAIVSLFGITAVLLRHMGIDRGSGSMFSVCEQAGARFGTEYGGVLEAVAALNSEALFSSHTFTEQQRLEAEDLYRRTLALLKHETSFWNRMKLRWILCVY